jgi:hypothetical protein
MTHRDKDGKLFDFGIDIGTQNFSFCCLDLSDFDKKIEPPDIGTAKPDPAVKVACWYKGPLQHDSKAPETFYCVDKTEETRFLKQMKEYRISKKYLSLASSGVDWDDSSYEDGSDSHSTKPTQETRTKAKFAKSSVARTRQYLDLLSFLLYNIPSFCMYPEGGGLSPIYVENQADLEDKPNAGKNGSADPKKAHFARRSKGNFEKREMQTIGYCIISAVRMRDHHVCQNSDRTIPARIIIHSANKFGLPSKLHSTKKTLSYEQRKRGSIISTYYSLLEFKSKKAIAFLNDADKQDDLCDSYNLALSKGFERLGYPLQLAILATDIKDFVDTATTRPKRDIVKRAKRDLEDIFIQKYAKKMQGKEQTEKSTPKNDLAPYKEEEDDDEIQGVVSTAQKKGIATESVDLEDPKQPRCWNCDCFAVPHPKKQLHPIPDCSWICSNEECPMAKEKEGLSVCYACRGSQVEWFWELGVTWEGMWACNKCKKLYCQDCYDEEYCCKASRIIEEDTYWEDARNDITGKRTENGVALPPKKRNRKRKRTTGNGGSR